MWIVNTVNVAAYKQSRNIKKNTLLFFSSVLYLYLSIDVIQQTRNGFQSSLVVL